MLAPELYKSLSKEDKKKLTFYTEFNSRIVAKLGINTKCEWKHMDMGCFGLHDYVYKTSCNEEFDSSKINRSNFCPKCGKFVV